MIDSGVRVPQAVDARFLSALVASQATGLHAAI